MVQASEKTSSWRAKALKNSDDIKDESGTPNALFDRLEREFHFSVDACASRFNAKLPKFYDKTDDGLVQDYHFERVWCNPPYSRGHKEKWVTKAYEETRKDCILWVLLLPTSTEQPWFQDIVRPNAEVRFVRGRIKFDKPRGFVGNWSSGRDSHMIVVFRNPKLLVW